MIHITQQQKLHPQTTAAPKKSPPNAWGNIGYVVGEDKDGKPIVEMLFNKFIRIEENKTEELFLLNQYEEQLDAWIKAKGKPEDFLCRIEAVLTIVPAGSPFKPEITGAVKPI